MKKFIAKIAAKLRVSFFPTEHDKELKRWYMSDPDEQLRYVYPLSEESIVIDLGGYKGQWASDIYARYNCNIYIFEPVNIFYEKIKKRFCENNKINVFCLALAANKRFETISINADASSMFGKDISHKETINVEDVASFFQSHQITSVDLIKINIEGGEFELLPRLIESGIIKNIKNIQIQFHNIDSASESNMVAICSELSKTHQLTYKFKFIWENWELIDS